MVFIGLLLWQSLVFATSVTQAAKPNTAQATFAGGCFWSMEPPFVNLPGVKSVVVGYTGGHKDNPTYEEVSTGQTGHVESVQITYDPKKLKYQTLLDVFWKSMDPTDNGGQFADRGSQYQSVIFYADNDQRKMAEASKEKWIKSKVFKKPIVTRIVAATTFWPAEKYHQHFYKKNPERYHQCHVGSGRGHFLESLWGK